MEKKQFLWDFCSDWGVNSELFPTKRDKKHQKVFFYTNLASKMRLMEILGSSLKCNFYLSFKREFLQHPLKLKVKGEKMKPCKQLVQIQRGLFCRMGEAKRNPSKKFHYYLFHPLTFAALWWVTLIASPILQNLQPKRVVKVALRIGIQVVNLSQSRNLA